MGKTHDDAIFGAGRDAQRRGWVQFTGEGMITSGVEGRRDARIDACAVMGDCRGAAMYGGRGVHGFAAIGFVDALMAEADAQHRDSGTQFARMATEIAPL